MLRLTFAALALAAAAAVNAPAGEPAPLTLVVMDPLAADLSCPCVKGYAQREYDKLAKFLEGQVGRPVTLAFGESLADGLKKAGGRADLVVGKRSVVDAAAATAGVKLTPVMALSGKDGKTTQTGLIVVAGKNPAKSVAHLAGYRVLFGPADCDEKSAAAVELLKKHGVTPPESRETCPSCSTSATKLVDLGPDAKAAAVISSYAQPLLEGCGTVKKGDLRVVGATEPVPFVTAFAADALPAADREKLVRALGQVADHPALLAALESRDGFVPVEPATAKKK